jgi:4'-phosphopantetheinyl transferase
MKHPARIDASTPGDVDLWWMTIDGIAAGEKEPMLELLSADERARYEAFQVPSASVQFLVAHVLVRCALSHYRNVAPQRWRFDRNSHGRPFIVEEPGIRDLYFSITHTEGLVACAVGSIPLLGIDAEHRQREISIEEIAASVLTREEKRCLDMLAGAERRDRFLALWTLKEGYLKARGWGLSMPMSSVGFALDGKAIRAVFTKPIHDDPEAWAFHCLYPTEWHILSIAAAPEHGALQVALRQTTPTELMGPR